MSKVPNYRFHKAKKQAVVTIAGRMHYLGPWKSKASYLEYDRLIAEWLAAGRPSSMVDDATPSITINQLVQRFRKFAEK